MPVPAISSSAPKQNSTIVPGVRGAMVILSSNTIAVIGRTEARDSFTFSSSCGLILKIFSPFQYPSSNISYFYYIG